MIRKTVSIGYRSARRLVILLLGGTLLVLGLALLVLPGPAIIVLPAGLALLALEFAWARRWLLQVRRGLSTAGRSARLRR